MRSASDLTNDDDTADDEEEEGNEIAEHAFPKLETAKKEVDDDEDEDIGVMRCTVENANIMRPINNNIMIINIITPVASIGVNSHPLQDDIQLCGFIEAPVPSSPTNDDALIPTFYSSYFSKFKLEEAWGRENITHSQRPLSSSGWREFKLLMPILTCTDCCFHTGHHSVTVGICTTTNWYNGVFILSFTQLASHYGHVTFNEQNGVSKNINLSMVIHVTFPKEQLEVGQYKALPDDVKRVVAIMHDAGHYAVLEIAVVSKRIVIVI
jgi:hypothetical protein